MKTLLPCTLILTLSLLYTLSYAQMFCFREVTAFNAAPGGYAISGTALMEFSDYKALHFDAAFATQAGPDLHVYLATNFESPSTPGNTNVDLGELESNTGAQSYIIPFDIEIEDYDYVLIHCLTFNHWWGGGLLDTVNCTSATHSVPDESGISVFPNPTTDLITLDLKSLGIEKIIVADVLGNIRLNQSISNQNQLTLDVHELENGLFFVAGLNSQGEFVFRKSIIKSSN